MLRFGKNCVALIRQFSPESKRTTDMIYTYNVYSTILVHVLPGVTEYQHPWYIPSCKYDITVPHADK